MYPHRGSVKAQMMLCNDAVAQDPSLSMSSIHEITEWYIVCSFCLSMTPSHLFNGSDRLNGVIGERHTGYAQNIILPVGP